MSLDVGDGRTVMALSYALTVDELAGVAATVELVSEAEWAASGGQVVACAPPAACPPPTT